MATSLAFPFRAMLYDLISLTGVWHAHVYNCFLLVNLGFITGTATHTYFRSISFTARLFSLPGTAIWWLRARLIRLPERPF
jgi:hypothetical protein